MAAPRVAALRGPGPRRSRLPLRNQEGSMKTKAAILRDAGQDFEVTELDLDPPKAGEVLIRYVAAGLCHSDEHLRRGDIVPRVPLVGGDEGGGGIEGGGGGGTPPAPGG